MRTRRNVVHWGVWGIFALLPLSIILGIVFVNSLKTARYSLEDINFTVSAENNVQTIAVWHDTLDDQHYLFLPSFSNGFVYMESPAGTQIVIDDKLITSEEPFQPEYSKIHHIDILDKQGKTQLSTGIIFLWSEKIPAMFIDTNNVDLEYIHEHKTYKETGKLYIIDSQKGLQYDGKLSYIKGRGNASWQQGKKSYNIQLGQASDLLQMGTFQKWSLISNCLDESNLRNKIVYDFADEVGLKYSPKSEFVDLYINHEYLGLYLLTEANGNGRIAINDLDTATQAVNFASLNRYRTLEKEVEGRPLKGFLLENNPSDITGGYLFEMETKSRYHDAQNGFATSRNQHITIYSPRYPSIEQVEYGRELIQEFEDALFAESGVNAKTGKSYLDYIDLDSWAKKYLIEEVFKNLDSGVSSNFFYKDSDEVDPLLYAGPVWDYDWSIGNGALCISDPKGFYASQAEKKETLPTRWYAALYNKSDFYDAVLLEFKQQFIPLLNKLIDVGIYQYVDQIQSSYKMNEARWKNSNKLGEMLRFDSLQTNAQFIASFLRLRMEFFQDVWYDGVQYHEVTLRTNDRITRTMFIPVLHGDTLQPIVEFEEAKDFEGFYYVDTNEPLDYNRPIEEDIVIYVKWKSDSPSVMQNLQANLRPILTNTMVVLIVAAIPILLVIDHKLHGRRKAGHSD